MARTQLDGDTRRGRPAGRASAFANPVPVAAPLIATAVAIALAVVLSVAAGLPTVDVLIAAGAVYGAATVFAHRTVTSMFAGLALLLVRPYSAGERVRISSPADGCPFDAVIVHIGLANTTLASDDGMFVVPNNRLLRNPPAPAAPPSDPCPQLTP